MKEKDVRDRINAFLRNRLQNLVVPASMGIGLALGACDASALKANPDSSADSSSIQPRSGGAGGGLTGNGGTMYGAGGFASPSSGGAGGGFGGAGGFLYGLAGSTVPRSGGAGGGTLYGLGGTTIPRSGGAGGGLPGTGGTVYGMGGFRDAGPSAGGGMIDSGEIPEAGKSEAGQGLDSMISEAGVAPPTDAKDSSPRDRGTAE
jgi:hypothetical protein